LSLYQARIQSNLAALDEQGAFLPAALTETESFCGTIQAH
jgi:hypothetical protein